jgi:hypothetical protein
MGTVATIIYCVVHETPGGRFLDTVGIYEYSPFTSLSRLVEARFSAYYDSDQPPP